MRFVKEVVFLKIINANSFLVVKKRESLIFNRKKGPKDREINRYPLRPRDIICNVQIQNNNLKCNIPNFVCISFYFHNSHIIWRRLLITIETLKCLGVYCKRTIHVEI